MHRVWPWPCLSFEPCDPVNIAVLCAAIESQCTTLYRPLIVTFALSSTVSDICNKVECQVLIFIPLLFSTIQTNQRHNSFCALLFYAVPLQPNLTLPWPVGTTARTQPIPTFRSTVCLETITSFCRIAVNRKYQCYFPYQLSSISPLSSKNSTANLKEKKEIPE